MFESKLNINCNRDLNIVISTCSRAWFRIPPQHISATSLQSNRENCRIVSLARLQRHD